MTGAPTQRAGSEVRSTSSGAGRALVAVYGIFALAATARASVQLLTKFDQAPLAYLLSALAGVIYIVATITLARGTRASRRLALIAIIIELVGVVIGRYAQRLVPGCLSAGDGVVCVRDRLRVRTPGTTDTGAGVAVAYPGALILGVRASRLESDDVVALREHVTSRLSCTGCAGVRSSFLHSSARDSRRSRPSSLSDKIVRGEYP